MKTDKLRRATAWLLLAMAGIAQAQTSPAGQPASNEQVLQDWQQRNVGGQQPELVPQEDGSTRIEWRGGVTADTYRNTIINANGATNTPLTTGSFYKVMVQSDLRGTTPGGDVNYFQFGLTQSDDRAVLSQYQRQINNVQLGRAGQGYLVALGDVMPNFSALSSALGARGLIGQRQFGDAAVYGYAGVVTESWEAYEGKVVRNQFMRDVQGVKFEYALTPGLKVFATGQSGEDRAGSLTNPAMAAFAMPARVRSNSTGFQFLDGQFQVAGETANSRYEQTGQEGRAGRAQVLDGSWRGESVGLRAGYHDLAPEFASLSAMAVAGIKEGYVGGDWSAATWLALGADLRNSKNRTLATVWAPSTTTDTDSGTLRANINFGPDLPGWGVGLQRSESRTTDSLSQLARNIQNSTMLNYWSQHWSGGIGYGLAKMRSQASPAFDSDTTSWNLSLGRAFSDADGVAPASWSLNVNFAASFQEQRLLAGSETRNVNYTLSLSGQRTGWGSLALLLTNGLTTQPTGLPGLKLRAAQLEAIHPFTAQSALKLYVRNTQRNIGDPLLGADERVAGAQLNYYF